LLVIGGGEGWAALAGDSMAAIHKNLVHYNFGRIYSTLRVTPGDGRWTLKDGLGD